MNLARRLPALVLGVACFTDAMAQSATDDWPAYGRDPGGARYSPLADIDRSNVASLEARVDFPNRTCSASRQKAIPRFETTPIVVDGVLYLTTPLGELIALDPATGAERWRFDPKSRRNADYGDFANRGVSTWLDRRRRRTRLAAGGSSSRPSTRACSRWTARPGAPAPISARRE